MNLMFFLFAGIVLFLVFRLGAQLGHNLLKRVPFRLVMIRWLTLLELFAWIAYAFWGSYVLFGGMRYYDHLLLVMAVLLLFGVGWYFFRDFFAGMVIRSDYRLRSGQFVRTPVAEGMIRKLGSRYMELENDNGEKIRIPFSQLSRSWINIPAEAEHALSNRLLVALPGNTDPMAVKSSVEAGMMGMPWIINAPPAVRVKKDHQGQFMLEIRYDILHDDHNLLVEQKIKEIVASSRD